LTEKSEKKNSQGRATEELLDALHGAIAEDLVTKIRSGDASPAELAAAIRFLKDNNITAVPDLNPGLKALAEDLPSFIDSEDGI